jgi:hypothetical protein
MSTFFLQVACNVKNTSKMAAQYDAGAFYLFYGTLVK